MDKQIQKGSFLILGRVHVCSNSCLTFRYGIKRRERTAKGTLPAPQCQAHWHGSRTGGTSCRSCLGWAAPCSALPTSPTQQCPGAFTASNKALHTTLAEYWHTNSAHSTRGMFSQSRETNLCWRIWTLELLYPCNVIVSYTHQPLYSWMFVVNSFPFQQDGS